ncbi:MAG: 30S ribosomal protein S4 [Patescibacteria group bacterium]|nr:30S ribosomal protein S4 [Patescibacteria group bacterium]
MDNNNCRQCRKFGTKLFLKGERCLTPKCAVTRRNYAPGGQGAKTRPPRKSEYGIQLLEKQKAKTEYGLRERQFSKIFQTASKSKTATGSQLLKLLEIRLDNVIYRLGWASSRAQARQIVLHRKIKLNDKIANIPSIVLKVGDIVSPKDKKSISPVKAVLPKWLKLDVKDQKAEILRLPERTEIESDIDEQLITEFYSR